MGRRGGKEGPGGSLGATHSLPGRSQVTHTSLGGTAFSFSKTTQMAFPLRGGRRSPRLIAEKCWPCALALRVDPYRNCACQAASPAKRQRRGRLRGLPLHSLRLPSRCPGQPPEQTRSPKSEFQFSSATRSVHISPPGRRRGARVRARGRRWQTGLGGGALSAPSCTYAEKEKGREKRGLIKAKTQDHPL